MRRRLLLAPAVVLFLALFLTRAVGAQERGVEDALARWVAAFAELDGATSAAVYALDGHLWGTIATQPAKGREAIRAYFDSGRQRARSRRVVMGEYITRVYGTTAVSSGRYDFHTVLLDGSSTLRRARFSMTFVNQDGAWLIVDHHSSEVPAAP